MQLPQSVCNENIIDEIKVIYEKIRVEMQSNFYPISERAEIKIVNADILGPYFDGKGLVINPKKCELLQKGILPLLIMHELEPGHFYFYKQLNGILPEPNDALIEGWSLYVEDFCPETPETRYGIMLSKLIRYVRVIGDVLYHTGQFNDKQLREFLKAEFPFSNRIEEEIKRIKTMKGYAMCYVFGEQFYTYLKEKYASRFDSMPEYHKFLFEGLRKMNTQKRTDIQFLLDYFNV